MRRLGECVSWGVGGQARLAHTAHPLTKHSSPHSAPITLTLKVKPGDTPESLAARTGISPQKIVAANRGTPTLQPHTTLKLELPFALSEGAVAAVRALEAGAAPAGTALPPAPTLADVDVIKATATRVATAVQAARTPTKLTPMRVALDVAFVGACAAAAAVLAAGSRSVWTSMQRNARRSALTKRSEPLREALKRDGMSEGPPPWLRGRAVWRVRGADGSEANVPLPPPGVVFGTVPPSPCWLAWEAEADAAAWVDWLVGETGPRNGAERGTLVRAAPETLSAEAAASRRELVFMPASAVRVTPGDREAGVLAAVAAGAHARRGGAALISPEKRAALEEAAGVASVPSPPTTADARPSIAPDAVAIDLVGDGDATRFDGSPPAPFTPPAFTAAEVGPAGWYHSLSVTAVPVLRLPTGGAGLVTVGGDNTRIGAAHPGGVVVAFEDRADAERLAWAWHTSGTGVAVGADVAKLVAMPPAELDDAAAGTGAGVVVFRAGGLRVPPRLASEELLATLQAGVEAQLWG